MAGKLVHFELPAADAARARGFWSGVFGWEFGDPMGAEYWMTRTGEEQGGATLATIREAGGTADDKRPIAHVGWFAHCTDTEGNRFGVFQSDESVTAPG